MQMHTVAVQTLTHRVPFHPYLVFRSSPPWEAWEGLGLELGWGEGGGRWVQGFSGFLVYPAICCILLVILSM